MKKDQKGFSAVELLLVVVFVGLIGFVGWTVYQRQDKQNSQTTATQQTEKVPETYQRTTTVPSDWKTFENEEYKLTFSYPSDWTISTNLITKKSGEDMQNIFSDNATKIFVICYKETAQSQSCAEQININNQPFSQSLVQLRKYYSANNSPYQETELVLDGHVLVEFRSEARGDFPAEKSYYLDANGYTYGLTTVYEGEPREGSLQELSAADSLALFESIKIQ